MEFPLHKEFERKNQETRFASMVDLITLLRHSGYVIAKRIDITEDVEEHFEGDVEQYVDMENFLVAAHESSNQIVLELWGIDKVKFEEEKQSMLDMWSNLAGKEQRFINAIENLGKKEG